MCRKRWFGADLQLKNEEMMMERIGDDKICEYLIAETTMRERKCEHCVAETRWEMKM